MTRAMLFKELRETMWIALAGVAVHVYCVLALIGVDLLTLRVVGRGEMPFLRDNFLGTFAMVAVCVAAVLGLRQTVTESSRGTWLFLLQRPVSRRRLLTLKLGMGLALCLMTSAFPILVYGWWAATPGTHPNPFEWSMTLSCWQGCASITGVYLAAFLSGIRPARWFGTRLAPLVGAGLLLALIQFVPHWWVFGLGALVLIDVWLAATILVVAQTRDFS